MNAVELVGFINSIIDGKSKVIPGTLGCYAVNANGLRGVAIDSDDEATISEKFNQVEITNCNIIISGVGHNVVLLFTKEATMSEHYGFLCLDFLSPGNRQMIQKHPLEWFEGWRNLLGDTKKRRTIYDYIGEMKTLLSLKEKGEQPKWDSMIKGTYDISTDKALYEVKSTKMKSEEVIEVHNQYQLDASGFDRPLFIAFCKVEENDAGESIDSLYGKLVAAGFDKNELDQYLEDSGYGPGKADRYKTFLVHEIRLYPVDEKFPKICKDSFKDGKIPAGIVNYQYSVSLDGLSFEKLI
jgi:hypothetical protein